MGFGDKGGHTHVEFGLFPFAFCKAGYCLCQVDDRLQVLMVLSGETDHKVEFDQIPASPIDFPGHTQNVRVGQWLVNDLSQPVATRLRSERKTRFPDPLNLVEPSWIQTVNPKGGKTDCYFIF